MIKNPKNKESKRFREQNSKKYKRKLLSFIFFALLLGANIISIYIFQEINLPQQNSSNGVIIPHPPRESSVYYEDLTSEAEDVYVRGNYAYVADGSSGLAVIDISDPTNPGTPVYKDTTGDAGDIYVSGNYAYIADWGSGLAVIDISNPTNPGTPVYEDTNGHAFGVFVRGSYAYVADWDWGLAIIDISNPTNPRTPIYKGTTGDASKVYVSGNYAYVSNTISGLAIIDISTPTNPGTPVYVDTATYANSVYVSGNYAYVSDAGSGLAVIDISDPTNPGTPVYEDTTGWGCDIYVSGDYAYQADAESGLAVIDISIPVNPGTPVYEDTIGRAYGVYVSGDYAYLAITISPLGYLAVIDISNPIINGPNDFSVEYDYSGQYLSWIATDTSPSTYTIELEGMGVVAGPTAWLSGIPVIYNIPDGFALGDYLYTINFTDTEGNYATDSVIFTVEDTTDPVITDTPSDLNVEYGYTGQSFSWTTTDANPGTYTIELVGTGIVAGPTVWTSGIAVTYNIPDGFAVGDYVYTINFTDTEGNYATDSVTFTVEDTTDPVITDTPSDLNVEYGYTGQSFSWTATDANPGTYTIELVGTGIVAGPTVWTSSIAVTYNIPDGFAVGDYVYTINFTDTEGNYATDSVTFTVEDTTDPVITNTPSDLNVEYGYTGQSFSWTATDANPGTYTIELVGTGIVVGPTVWSSGIAVTYNIPDGFAVGDYVYTINFTDIEGNFDTDSVTFTVEDTTNPVITDAPTDLNAEYGYTGQSLSWTATDVNPSIYTIELIGTGIVAGPTVWSSGIAIIYNIPDGFALGDYLYTINFTDTEGNFATDNVTFTVQDTTIPVITDTPADLTVEEGYTAQNVSWTATDANPNTYTIKLEGTGIVAGPTAWTNGIAITYDIPDGLSPGVYTYIITFIDDSNNPVSDTVVFIVEEIAQDGKGAISFGNYFILLTGLSIIGLVILIKRKITR